jgi:hypothetical protein
MRGRVFSAMASDVVRRGAFLLGVALLWTGPGIRTANAADQVRDYVYAGKRLLVSIGPGPTATPTPTPRPTATPTPLPPTKFYTVLPCRVLDTRNAAGAYGAPALSAGTSRNFQLRGQCGVPTSALMVSVNITVTGPTVAGNLELYAADSPPPGTSNINYLAGQTRANNAIVPASLAVKNDQASGTADFILDVNGYFQ